MFHNQDHGIGAPVAATVALQMQLHASRHALRLLRDVATAHKARRFFFVFHTLCCCCAAARGNMHTRAESTVGYVIAPLIISFSFFMCLHRQQTKLIAPTSFSVESNLIWNRCLLLASWQRVHVYGY